MPSSIPAAIDALVATVTGLPDFTDVQIIDGWPATREAEQLIAIAYGNDAVAGEQEAAWAGGRRNEKYDIACIISIWVGGYENAQQAAARTRAFALLAAIETAIRPVSGMAAGATLPDQSGTPTVLYGEITDIRYQATDGDDEPMGRFADIAFTVRAEKYI